MNNKKDVILSVENLCRFYAGVAANNNINLSIMRGEIHAIAGENGAGKSTLIKMLTGAVEPSKGRIVYNGQTYSAMRPDLAINEGISTVYQEFNLVPYLSVSENIYLGREPMKGGIVNKKKMNQDTQEIFDLMEVGIDPNMLVSHMGVAQQQLVEIAKAVSINSKVLILDEPTAPLTTKESKVLFDIIHMLNKRGISIIYISHRLEEIFDLCDRVSILRDGELISTYNIVDIDENILVRDMIGRSLEGTYPERQNVLGDIVFEVNQLANDSISNINFQLRRGEILGFGGLVGSGRSELMETIFGARETVSGTMLFNGNKYRPNSPKEALDYGIGLIPEDRKKQGIVLTMNVDDNILMCSYHKALTGGVISNKSVNRIANEQKEVLNIKTPTMKQLVANLSGGNQQKVVLAKILSSDCDLIIFDEPTRGIDVGAKQEIYELVRELVNEGKSVIMVSSDMPELLGMSDRVLIMREGTIVGELERDDFSQEEVLLYAAGLKSSIKE